ncbi:MAG: arsenate reductase family protein [Ignavibacterium sp.]
MEKIIVYEKPTCTTCRNLFKILTEKGIDFDKVDYYIEPFTKTKLKNLLKKMNMKPSELLRENDRAFKDLKLNEKNFSEDEILNLMVENPDLVQRPIVEKGEKAILARPVEKVFEIL